ncbi:MAG: nodulation protein NfeD [Dehalococcoidia bacterium]|nr:nodulation protein NfeD [Dehalococcoidia bacterium]
MNAHSLSALRRIFTILLLLAGVASLAVDVARAAAPTIRVLQIKGTINPVTAGYLVRGIQQAEEDRAGVVLIEVDTPGGLDTSMREMVQAIVNSRVPVVTYVAPAGARAASAGMFIVMAGHIAAMAPNTAIGAAHPVNLGGGEQSSQDRVSANKAEADAAAYARSIAELRGRNKEWAEGAVRLTDTAKGSATADEALKLNVIDLVATNRDDLLDKLEGRNVRLLTGEATLQTRLAPQEVVEMSLFESFLFAISNPNVAFILLSLATIGIFFELANPGAILPGVVGGVFLLLALYSLGTLDVNWTGLLLIAFAFLLFLAEVFVTSHGILAVGGVISFALGAMLLFSASPLFALDLRVLGIVLAALIAYFAFVTVMVRKAHLLRVTVGGAETLVGRTATARTDLSPEGYVFIEGERWLARAEGAPVKEGDTVTISKVKGMKLWVMAARKEEEENA